MLMANETYNISPSLQDPLRRSPLQIFSKSNINISHKHYKPFGCPVYVLVPDLQNSNPYHKWKSRSKPGIYLGYSPLHNRNVALVLNIETGRVSPQFHVKYDRRFHTVLQQPIEPKWLAQAGFTDKPSNEDDQNTIKSIETPKRKRQCDEAYTESNK